MAIDYGPMQIVGVDANFKASLSFDTPAPPKIRINLGCGTQKIPGFLNVDSQESVKPDLIGDIAFGLPLDSGKTDEIYMIHCIEHVPYNLHPTVLREIWRLLKPGGLFFVSYPEFEKCVNHFLRNTGNQWEFWRATLYGRQLHPGDYHMAPMQTSRFKVLLEEEGFKIEKAEPEPMQEFNTYVRAIKAEPLVTYEELLSKEIFGEKKSE